MLAGQAAAPWPPRATKPAHTFPPSPLPAGRARFRGSCLKDTLVSKGTLRGHREHRGLGHPEDTQANRALEGLEKETRTKYWALISHLLFSPAEPCEFIKATEALASRYVAMPRCGSSLFCQVRKPPATRFKPTYLSLVRTQNVKCLLFARK